MLRWGRESTLCFSCICCRWEVRRDGGRRDMMRRPSTSSRLLCSTNTPVISNNDLFPLNYSLAQLIMHLFINY
jgi:hypothetical protein